MRSTFALSAALVAIGLTALAVVAGAPAAAPQAKLSVSDIYSHPFEIDFRYDQKLNIDLQSGDFHIVGSTAQKLAVRASGHNAEKARDMTLTFKHFGIKGDLHVTNASSKDGPEITIEVPKASDLFVRMPFGDLTIVGVSGDKDVELHAGDLTIEVGSAADYAHVDASVNAGDLSAGPFGESKDGLFRPFEKSGTGRYKLHAHVGAGDLTLH